MFQFTHPGKGATVLEPRIYDLIKVSIHAPWEGCDTARDLSKMQGEVVSIHAPWEGCDAYKMLGNGWTVVSIHAPWEGCDKRR